MFFIFNLNYTTRQTLYWKQLKKLPRFYPETKKLTIKILEAMASTPRWFFDGSHWPNARGTKLEEFIWMRKSRDRIVNGIDKFPGWKWELVGAHWWPWPRAPGSRLERVKDFLGGGSWVIGSCLRLRLTFPFDNPRCVSCPKFVHDWPYADRWWSDPVGRYCEITYYARLNEAFFS